MVSLFPLFWGKRRKRDWQAGILVMKAKQMYLIIGFMAISLLGIIGLQVQQIRKAMALNEFNFSNNVNEALHEVVEKLEGAEIKTTFVRVSRELAVNPEDSQIKPQASRPISRESTISMEVMEGQPDFPLQKIRIRDSMAIVTEQEAMIQLDTSLWQGGRISYLFIASDDDSLSEDSRFEFRGHPEMVRMVKRTLDGLSAVQIPIQERIDSAQVDTMLRSALAARGIFQSFDFQVQSSQNGLAFASGQKIHTQGGISPQQLVELFPNIGSMEQSFLSISFPNRRFRAFQAVWLQALASVVFCGIILFSFWITMRTVIRQKQLSEMKNDFINNMTHELKTPIATISLAADALMNPRMASAEGSLQRYTRIIKEENQRMNLQVERVLQAARFQRKEIKLQREEVEVHELIQKAVRHLELPIQQREGRLGLQLDAQQSRLKADPHHLANMLNNLLDNANKYSPERPQIDVCTRNEGEELVIQVVDQGPGISKADQTRIFDRFYRVSTGDLHEVKGFGLGLSYVREMAEAHGGSISVLSSLGKGSTFEIRLPLEPTDSPPA
jgi:signal transduction histidine kinase